MLISGQHVECVLTMSRMAKCLITIKRIKYCAYRVSYDGHERPEEEDTELSEAAGSKRVTFHVAARVLQSHKKKQASLL